MQFVYSCHSCSEDIPESKRIGYIQKRFYMVKLRRDDYDAYRALIVEVRVRPLPVFDKKTGHWCLEGVKEGIARGIEKGLLLDAQEFVIEALGERFGYVDEGLNEEIIAIQSQDVLLRGFIGLR